MKSGKLSTLALTLMLFPFIGVSAESLPEAELKAQAMEIVREFGGALKPRLLTAMKSGGPAQAVAVCAEEAPKIAKNLSDQTGWLVKRVSLKPRNTDSATPDDVEIDALQAFNLRQAEGEPASSMVFSRVIGDNYRFIKPQAVEGLCLSCHGTSLPSDVRQVLTENYPEDMTTGYSIGEIRGAFSLTKPL